MWEWSITCEEYFPRDDEVVVGAGFGMGAVVKLLAQWGAMQDLLLIQSLVLLL